MKHCLKTIQTLFEGYLNNQNNCQLSGGITLLIDRQIDISMDTYWQNGGSIVSRKIQMKLKKVNLLPLKWNTVWKVFVFGVIMGRIFSHLNWIRRDTVHLSVFSRNAGKCGPE